MTIGSARSLVMFIRPHNSERQALVGSAEHLKVPQKAKVHTTATGEHRDNSVVGLHRSAPVSWESKRMLCMSSLARRTCVQRSRSGILCVWHICLNHSPDYHCIRRGGNRRDHHSSTCKLLTKLTYQLRIHVGLKEAQTASCTSRSPDGRGSIARREYFSCSLPWRSTVGTSEIPRH